MSIATKEWLLKTIAELEEERDAVPGVVNEDAVMALAAMKLALASLEAEAVAIVEPSDYVTAAQLVGEEPRSKAVRPLFEGALSFGQKLYAVPRLDNPFCPKCGGTGLADSGGTHPWGEPIYIECDCRSLPPAPVSVPDEVIVFLNHLEDVLPDEAFNLIDVKTWNNVSMLSRHDVYRAAMLQGSQPVSQSDELPPGIKPAPELDSMIKNDGLPPSNSPVIPDGWVLVPVELTQDMRAAWDSAPNTDDDDHNMHSGYRAMIAAAPQWEVSHD